MKGKKLWHLTQEPVTGLKKEKKKDDPKSFYNPLNFIR